MVVATVEVPNSDNAKAVDNATVLSTTSFACHSCCCESAIVGEEGGATIHSIAVDGSMISCYNGEVLEPEFDAPMAMMNIPSLT